MLRLGERLARSGGADGAPPGASVLTLTYDERRHSRRRVRLDDGREAALLLPRGTVLADGDLLRATGEDEDLMVIVRAAPETLSVGRTADRHLLARAAYHLGNRHVPLEIHPDRLAWEHDHVLDALARELGLVVTVEETPFQPEGGGYGHGHGHSHGEHEHEHEHEHVHAKGGGHSHR